MVTPVGVIGDPSLGSSGDMLSLIGGGTYLTVKGGRCSDCLVEVDPANGSMLKMLGPIGIYSDVWGLAF